MDDSSPSTPQTDSIPLVQISHYDDEDEVYEWRKYRQKPMQDFILTPSCSSSSLAMSHSGGLVHVATQTDS